MELVRGPRCYLVLFISSLLLHPGSCQINSSASITGNYSIQPSSTLAVSSTEYTNDGNAILTSEPPALGHQNETDHHGESHGIHVASIRFDYVKQPLIITLFLIVAAISKLGFHHANFLSSIVPESCLLIILGTIVGAILKFSGSGDSFDVTLSPTLFFLFLLPPIILDAAYSLHDRVFFDNLGTILVYAVIGTLFNCFILGPALYGLAISGAMGSISINLIDCLVFSSLIVAVDPVAVLAIFQEIGVNNVLYFLVFGESLLNDAVTVVLYNTMTSFLTLGSVPVDQVFLGIATFFTVSLGGLSIGIIFGLLTSFMTKFTGKVRVVEPLAMLALAYAAYLMAELFHFSGIISTIGCGLVQAQYAFHNISNKSLITVNYVSKILSGTSDAVIFMFLGLALVRDTHVWHTGFVLWVLALCLLIRVAVVYGLTFLANRVWRFRKIDLEEQFIMAYGGLRGAVAFSLVVMLELDEPRKKSMFETTTLAVIIFTVFIQGITIKPIVNLLRIRKEATSAVSIYQEINSHVTDHLLAGIEEIVAQYGRNFIREKLEQLDDKYLKRLLQKHPISKEEHILELFQEIALQLHYENVASADELRRYTSDVELYKPSIKRRTLLGNDSELSRVMSLGPELGGRAYSVAGRQRAYRRQSAMQKETKDVESHEVSDPSIQQRQGGAKKRWGAVRTAMATGSLKKRKSFASTLFGIEEDDDSVKENPTVNDVRKWLVQNPKMNDMHKKYDPNITQDEKTDLMHHLHEKQRRQARYRRHSLAPWASTSSVDRSLPHLKANSTIISEKSSKGDNSGRAWSSVDVHRHGAGSREGVSPSTDVPPQDVPPQDVPPQDVPPQDEPSERTMLLSESSTDHNENDGRKKDKDSAMPQSDSTKHLSRQDANADETQL